MNPEQARDLIFNTFTQAFDKNRFIEFARNLLNHINEDKTNTMTVPDAFAPHVRTCWRVGTYESPEGEQADVLIVHTTEPWKLERTRTALRDFVAHKLKRQDSYKEAGLVAFVSPDARSWRFSYVRMEYETRRDPKSGKIAVEERLTPARRYSYLVGEGESCHTAQTRFLDLLEETDNNPTLAQLEEAFSVEKVTKEFFQDFSSIFQKVVADILNRNRGWTAQQAGREAQTLLSRLLFLYFVQRKGWLDRRRDYLYSKCKEYFAQNHEGTSCYDQFLKALFVKLSDVDAYFPNLELGDVPFLNGGLFDEEMGSLTDRGRMKVGNPVLREVFEGLLELYNFTVREDTPLEQEVAIDPEMLGKIFESLVLQLEQSDTGGKTSRHDTGSYYTPRPIVHYLCREGLRAWLEQFPPSAKTSNWLENLEKLFSIDASEGINKNQRAVLDACLTPEDARALVDRLDGFRACDPAVGSGAFLVGLLHELVSLHRLCETRARGKDPADGDTDWLYHVKKRIIENVLYGVDLQERAVEICKLRLWLSLMVDYPLDVVADNCALADFRKALRKITPLPNLDFKIRRANSLIEQIRGHAVKFPQAVVGSHELALSLNRLGAAKHRFYEARSKKEKRAARLDILDATAELAQYEFNAAKLKFGLLPGDKDAERLGELAAAEFEMGRLKLQIAAARKKGEREKDDDIERLGRVFDDEAKPTFVWQLDFAEIFHRFGVPPPGGFALDDARAKGPSKPEPAAKAGIPGSGGFDLVMANPPYVRQEKITYLKPDLDNVFDCYTGTADLYVYFYERGLRMLRPGGVLSYISSNKFFRAAYGEKLRKFLAENAALRSVIDFGDLPLFEATAYPCIIVAQRGEANPKQQVNTLKVKSAEDLDRFTQLATVAMLPLPQKDFGSDGWRLESPSALQLLEKLRHTGKKLGVHVKGRFFRGVVTGLNAAFYVDRETKERLISADLSSAQLLKSSLRGEEVRKYQIRPGEQFLLRIPYGLTLKLLGHNPGQLSPGQRREIVSKNENRGWSAFRERYPAVSNHLSQFAPKARARGDQGDFWWELRPCDYYEEVFEKTKIVFPQTGKQTRFAMDVNSLDLDQTVYAIAVEDWCLLGVLNSSLINWYLRQVTSLARGGYLRFLTQYLETLPIAEISTRDDEHIANSAREIQRLYALQQKGVERFARRGSGPPLKPERGEMAESSSKIKGLETEIDKHVANIYGLTPEEIKIVEDATK